MTEMTQPPGRLLTVAEYAVLGEDDRSRWELQEGNLIMSPSPSPDHMIAGAELYVQLREQLPAHLCAVPDVDLNLELVPEREPGTARRPDLVVVERRELDRVRSDGGLLRARSVQLVVEIVSPGSRRMDRVVKRGEYAEAGIPNYWIVDLESPVSLIVCHLAGAFGYRDSGETTGTFESDAPSQLRIDLDRLG
jgi:Uma2 family endonuclease